jgi:hypothetical protein
MNSFEQFTVIIGVLAILFEGIKQLKEKIKHWQGHH